MSIALLAIGALAVIQTTSEPEPAGAASAVTPFVEHTPSTASRYTVAHGCYALKAPNGKFVTWSSSLGYRASAVTGGSRFRMQPTGLGRYLFYASDRRMPSVGFLDAIVATTTPGRSADWSVQKTGGRFTLTAISNSKRVAVDASEALVLTTGAAATFELVTRTGCASFPEVEVNVNGTPRRSGTAVSPVVGLVDTHLHVSAFQFLGGRFHCGRPWSPYGVTVALKDCPDHEPDGSGAVAENFLATGSPVGTHSTEGWPGFAGWPRPESLTHEGTYWRWLERSWRAGLRIIVNDVVENRALCDIYPLKRNDCDEMVSARLQINDMLALQSYIDAQSGGPGKGWFRIVFDPTEARAVVGAGRLAVVLGMETSEPLGCGRTGDTPHCDEAQIDTQLQEFYDLGIRSLFPVHKFDNALGGTHYDSGATGVLVNAGNRYATGEFWEPQPCAPSATDHDNEPTNLTGPATAPLYAIFGPVVADELLSGTLPVYPPGPLCNPRGLTDLGAHLINRMMDLGMIIETDHMSVKARQEALDIIEGAGYSGLVSSHSWGDAGSLRRVVEAGGFIGPYAGDSTDFGPQWQEAKSYAEPGAFFGIGFGADTNGLGAQGNPRPGAASNPVTYPFTSAVGGFTVSQQRSGTRTYNVNNDGVPHYGLIPDWVQDLRILYGNAIVTDLVRGAEAYLRMWASAAI